MPNVNTKTTEERAISERALTHTGCTGCAWGEFASDRLFEENMTDKISP